MDNLVQNGDFSQTKDGKPVAWVTSGDVGVTQTLRTASEGGNPSAELRCTRYERKSSSSHAMIAQVGIVRLEKGKCYEFTCRARAEGLHGKSVTVAIRDTDGWHACGLHKGLGLGRAWREFRQVFWAARSVGKTSRLQFWYCETGTFYLDDVRIVEIAPRDVAYTDTVRPTGARNLVPNGSFEAGGAGWSSVGKGAGWGNLPRLHGRIESTGGTQGACFLRIPLGGEETPVLHFDYLWPVVRRELQPLAANRGWIPVEKGEPYTLSCDMRASVDGVTAVLSVRERDVEDPRGGRQRRKVALSTAWKRHSFTFSPSRRYLYVTIGPDVTEQALAEYLRVDVDIDAVQLERGEVATAFQPRSPVEVGIEPSEPGGIFTQWDRASLLVRAHNHGLQTARVRLDFEVTDFFDKPAHLPHAALSIPAGSAVEHEVCLPHEWKGYYKLRMQYEVMGRTESRTLRLAVVPRRTADDSVLGVNHAFATPYLIRLAKKAGVTWYRDWTLKWQDLEPSPGEFRWEVSDPQVDRVVEEGVNLMALMPPFPSAQWSSEAPPGIPTKGGRGVRLREAWGPKDPRELGDFVASAVSRYSDRIGVWEFLNEPIYTDYALPGLKYRGRYPGKLYTVQDYVELLGAAASGMRRADPGCRVMAGIGGWPDNLTREVIEAGCLRYADIFNLHTYPGAKSPEGFISSMDRLLAIMDEHGGRKPIWMTEFSYYAADDLPRRPFIPSPGSWAEERLLASERECAEYTIRFLTIMLARGVEKVFLHSGASGTVNESRFECCIFKYGGEPRKALPALAVFTELLGPQPRHVAERSFGEAGYCFAFETGEQAVLVLWTEDEGADITIGVPPSSAKATEGQVRRSLGEGGPASGVRFLNVVGESVPSRAIRLSTAPAYLLGHAGEAKELMRSLDSGRR